MAKLQYIKKQIELIKQIQHVTRTMKTISAVRWRMGKKTLESAKNFSEHLLRLNESVYLGHGNELIEHPPSYGYLIVGIFSDKGLVGGFNTVLANRIKVFIENQVYEKNKLHLIILGTQGISYFKKYYQPNILMTQSLPVHQIPHFQNVRDILFTIRSFHQQKLFSHLYIAYNHYLSVSQYQPVIQRVIPIPVQSVFLPYDIQEDFHFRIDILSSPNTLMERLTFDYVASQLYVFLTESFLSEQATRLTIMDAATSHSEEMIHSLQILYQKKRQEKITQELNEISSASQVLGTL